MSEDLHKKKFSLFLQSEIKSLQKQILDLAEIAVPASNWKPLRSKLLGVTNDFRRDIEQELNKNYNIKYAPGTQYEDVVQIKPIIKSNSKVEVD